MTRAAGMAQFSQRLGLDLADTLTGNIKLFSNLFEGTGSAVVKTETELDHMLLTGREGMKLTLQLLSENVGGSRQIGRAHV